MAFLNPLLLFGAAAIASPIIIHLLNSRKVKRVVWAAMRFLQPAVQRNQRRMTLEDLILLALRCLLLILLALAFARPAFRASGGRGKVTAAILIDNSYSMSQTDGVSSRLEKAQKAAEQYLDALPTGSSVALFYFSDVTRPVIPEPTFDLNLARKLIRETPLSSRATDVQPALTQALDILQKRSATRKEIVLFTDGQANGWRQFSAIRQALDDAKNEVQARVVLAGAAESGNLCVSDLRLASPLAPVNQSLRFEVEVTNFGHEDARNVQVSLSVDDEAPSDQGGFETIPAGQTKRLSLFAKLREPGFRTITARLPHDHLPADDERSIAVRATKEINVLLVDGESGAEPRDSEVFFLRNALTPVPFAQREAYFLKTKTIAPADLDSAQFGEYDAVALANVADFSETVTGALEKYLRRGGGLIVFPGGKINPDFYNQKLAKQSGILPAGFGEPHGDATKQNAEFHLQDKGYEHPIVSIWRDPAAGTLATANFFRAFPLQPEAATTTANKDAGEPVVVVKFADGSPAVMERTFGFGRVIQFGSTADTAWNDLPVRPAFVPLMQRVLGAIMRRQDEQLNIKASAKFAFLCDLDLLGRDVTVIKPGGKKDASSLRRIGMVNGQPMIEFDDTDQAGAYEVAIPGAASATTAVKFAVQFDPQESQPDESTQINTLAPLAQVIRWTPELNLRDALERERGGREVWMAFAILALVTAGAETFLADRFSRAK